MSAVLQATSPQGEGRSHPRLTPQQAIVLGIVQDADCFRPDFAEYLRENWHVWLRFRDEADKVRARGRAHYSARTIGEVLRHESALSDDSPWKLNDHVWPDMARLYLIVTPAAAGFFELRGRQA